MSTRRHRATCCRCVCSWRVVSANRDLRAVRFRRRSECWRRMCSGAWIRFSALGVQAFGFRCCRHRLWCGARGGHAPAGVWDGHLHGADSTGFSAGMVGSGRLMSGIQPDDPVTRLSFGRSGTFLPLCCSRCRHEATSSGGSAARPCRDHTRSRRPPFPQNVRPCQEPCQEPCQRPESLALSRLPPEAPGPRGEGTESAACSSNGNGMSSV